jgi:hypothetical protein
MLNKIIINRILFSVIPFLTIFFFFVFARIQSISKPLQPYEYFVIFVLIILGIFLYIELKYILQMSKKSRELLENIPANIIKYKPNQETQRGRIWFFNTQIHLNENNLDIFKSNILKLSFSNKTNILTIFKSFGKRKLNIEDIKFLLVEYNDFYLYTLKGFMTRGELDKNRWHYKISVVLDNGKFDTLLDANIDETFFEINTALVYNDFETKAPIENNYFEIGNKIAMIIASSLRKDFLIIDYTN